MSKNNNSILNPQINELIDKIEKAQAQIAFCATAFDGNTKLVIQELKERKKETSDEYKALEAILVKFKNTCDTLESVARTVSIVPEKIDEKLSEFPDNFNNSIASSIPDLSKELCRTLESVLTSFKTQAEVTLNDTNSQMSNAVQQLKSNTDQIHHDMRNELNIYSAALEKIIDRSGKFRMRSFFWTVLLSSSLSAIMAITTFWFIVRV
jgi:archaellum component FlaC